jgi:hypothetical protein
MAPTRVHVWEKVEITLEAHRTYENPYTDVQVWVDLEGPGLTQRVYGFWDGGNTFRVRVVAPTPGTWTWRSGTSRSDAGMCGERGHLEAVAWTEAELAENPSRRGFLRASHNGHALNYADGTPCYLTGDTWWATPTYRYPWDDSAPEAAPEAEPKGALDVRPGMSFQEMVQYRKRQGYNLIAMIAALPAWANDGLPAHIWADEAAGLGIRQAWQQAGTQSAKDMHNEGGRPFLFPGRVPGYEQVVPDFDRINPAYFQAMDRKVDYLTAEGIIPFIEATRRDISTAWHAFYDWPTSYARYIQYIFSRYHAHNCILSPIHYDWHYMSIPSRAYNEPIYLAFEQTGPPPFGTLCSANPSGSTLLNFGEAPWLTLHQSGNWRDHDDHWLLTEIFNETSPPRPALNGEPYYAGWSDYKGWPDYEGWTDDDFVGGTEADDAACRSGMYGSFLSGGLAGHIYGAQGIWSGDIEPEARITLWDALQWRSGAQMEHLRTFVLSEGARYQDLAPHVEEVTPNKTAQIVGNEGWAYCARTEERDLFMLYFERGYAETTASQPRLRGALPEREYQASWFDPRMGTWSDAGHLIADAWRRIQLPRLPSKDDWALKLVLMPSF